MKRFTRAWLLLVSSIFIISASAQTVTLFPMKDNTIYQDNPGNSNGAGVDLFAGNTSGASPRRALIKFDIAAGVPAGATITSVTLTLNCNKTRAGADNVSLFKLLADWGEGNSNAGISNDGAGTTATLNDATWVCRNSNGVGGCTTAWTTPGGDFVPTSSAVSSVGGAVANYTWSSAQMAADVQAWQNTPANNFGWLIMGDETGFTTSKRFGSRENAARPSLVVNFTNPLPVTIFNLRGIETKSGITLQWETASEFNNAFFTIEHSFDGINFIAIDKVNGAGTSVLHHTYQFTDQGTATGQHYYRLVQSDINGVTHYSGIISINAKSNHLQLTLSPNPVVNSVNIGAIGSSTGFNYIILSSSGITVKKGTLTGNAIPVSGIPAGFYLLRVIKMDGSYINGLFLKQ